MPSCLSTIHPCSHLRGCHHRRRRQSFRCEEAPPIYFLWLAWRGEVWFIWRVYECISPPIRIFPILLISSYLPRPSLFLILPILSSLYFYLLTYLPHPLSASSSSQFLPYPSHPSRHSLFLVLPIISCILFYTFLIFLFFLSFPCSLPYHPNPLLIHTFFLFFFYLISSLFSPSFLSTSLPYPTILFLSSSSFSFSINIFLSSPSPLSLSPPPFHSPVPLHLFSSIFLALHPNFKTQNENTPELKTFFTLLLNISPFIFIIISLTIFLFYPLPKPVHPSRHFSDS
jgi:hypothetical protein